MLMMERINHALGDGIGDRDESEENDMSSTFSFTRPQHEGQDIRCFQDTSMGLVGALQFGIHRSVMGTNVRDTNRTVAEIGSMDMSGQRISNSVEVLNMMRGLPGNPRPFSMPDLYSRSPMVSMRTINTSALTNTSPMQYPMDRATPSSSTGMRGLEDSVTDFPTKPGIQELDKSTRKTFELDLNLPFPVKLHYILSNAKYQDCIAWLPHGRAWRVLKPKAFERRVIPKFFRSAKYASFMRQVNGWAFTRVTEGSDLNAYYHEMFLRGIPDLSFKMRRPPKVKNAASAARNAAGASAGTPDFYRIAEIAPLPASFPFKPEMQETKGVGSGSTGILTTRYLIRPLTSEDTLAEMDDLPFQKIAIKEDVSAETEIGLPFSDPFIGEDDSTNFFDSSASSSSEGKVEYPNTTAGQMKSTANSEIRAVTTTRGAGVDGNDSSTDEAALDVGTETTIHQLSKADVSYLAHQNRILLTYFDKQVEAGNNSTLPEIQS